MIFYSRSKPGKSRQQTGQGLLCFFFFQYCQDYHSTWRSPDNPPCSLPGTFTGVKRWAMENADASGLHSAGSMLELRQCNQWLFRPSKGSLSGALSINFFCTPPLAGILHRHACCISPTKLQNLLVNRHGKLDPRAADLLNTVPTLVSDLRGSCL